MQSAEDRSLGDSSLTDRIPTVEPEDASPEVRSVYADIIAGATAVTDDGMFQTL